MKTEEIKQDIYNAYEVRFGRLFKKFLGEKEREVCQFCDDAECKDVKRVSKNLDRAIQLMVRQAMDLAKKRGKNKADKVYGMLRCSIAPIDAVDSELDVLCELASADNELAAFMVRQIIKYTQKRLRQWKGKTRKDELQGH